MLDAGLQSSWHRCAQAHPPTVASRHPPTCRRAWHHRPSNGGPGAVVGWWHDGRRRSRHRDLVLSLRDLLLRVAARSLAAGSRRRRRRCRWPSHRRHRHYAWTRSRRRSSLAWLRWPRSIWSGRSCPTTTQWFMPNTRWRRLNTDRTHPKRQYWGGGAVVQPVLGGWQALYVLRTAENTHSATKAAAAQGVDCGCTRAQASRMALGSVPMG